jgi:DNA-binding NtrC family response regulator/tetratricopeptide (TPR) repeat protein
MNIYSSLVRHDDKFRFIAESPAIYGSHADYNHFVDRLNSLLKSDKFTAIEKADISLGLIYAARHRSNEPAGTFLSELNEIAALSTPADTLSSTVAYLRGSIYTLMMRDYSRSVAILDPLYHRLRPTNQHFLYGLVAKALGCAYMYLGRLETADETLQETISIFHRYGPELLYGHSLNDYAVLKKKMCHYLDAESLLKTAVSIAKRTNCTMHQLNAYNNLAIVSLKSGTGNFGQYIHKAESLRNIVAGIDNGDQADSHTRVNIACELHYERHLIMTRRFDVAQARLEALQTQYELNRYFIRESALLLLYLGEIKLETYNYADAKAQLELANTRAGADVRDGDIMSSILRYQASIELRMGNISEARNKTVECIRLSKRINDKLELGAAIRVLGEVHTQVNAFQKAKICFHISASILRNIQASYELMRSCVVFGSFLVDRREPDAELYLMEALQICKKLNIDYFLAWTIIGLSRSASNNENFTDARRYLAKAEKIYKTLQRCDRRQLRRFIDQANSDLDARILKKSLVAAEELKAICRVYEEARFPMGDIKTELAYQVAQNVGADSLFLIKRKGRGYSVPLTYNISVNEAKEIARRLDRQSNQPFLGIRTDPRIFPLHNGTTLVCIPANGQKGYVLCTHLSCGQMPSLGQLERLFAKPMVRLADQEIASRGIDGDEFIVAESSAPVTHPKGSFKEILTIDSDMIKLIRLAERVSISDTTVLLEGETGVGKELFARAIHENSPRRDRAFVAINSGGMPLGLLESQLFGNIKGAFTDAVQDRIGLIEDAHGGTVFLDEVGEMSPELQVKLLRLLENGEFRRLGENKVRIADVRVISATNRDLQREVERGRFRRDLYYRLGAVKLQVPALRFRKRDVELLMRHFLHQCAYRNRHTSRYFEIDVKAMEALELYNWPGNVRELQNEILRMVSLIGEGDVIRFGMLSQSIKEYLKSKNRPEGLLERSVERYERRLILDALNKNDWNRLRTAEELGLPRTTLIAKMKRLNVATKHSRVYKSLA